MDRKRPSKPRDKNVCDALGQPLPIPLKRSFSHDCLECKQKPSTLLSSSQASYPPLGYQELFNQLAYFYSQLLLQNKLGK